MGIFVKIYKGYLSVYFKGYGIFGTPYTSLEGGNSNFNTQRYGSLYVTLCFVLCRFDFGVFTFVC